MSTINLPELPVRIDWHDSIGIDVYSASQMREYAERAVQEALAAQVAQINEAVSSLSTYEVSASPIRKEYFKAGARRVIQVINSALIPEANHGKPT